MGSVDFINQEGKAATNRKPRQYDIEYTNPTEPDVTPPPKKPAPWWQRWKRDQTAKRAGAPSLVNSPTPAVVQSAAKPIVKTTAAAKRAVLPANAAISTASAHIPPVVIKSVAAPPPALSPAAELRRTSPQAAAVGEIHAQNVEQIKGKTTNPEPLPHSAFGVNLLPATFVKSLSQNSPVQRLLKLVLGLVTGIAVVYGGMIAYQSYYLFQAQISQTEIQQLENDIKQYADLQTEINSTSNTVTAINQLLQDHEYWTNAFHFLETYTLANVYYTGFSGSIDGTMSLQAVTSDFASVTQQINVFRSQTAVVQAVDVTTATRAEVATDEDDAVTNSLVHFTLNLQLSPELFYYPYSHYDLE